jgi:Tol biopolymer transport system component
LNGESAPRRLTLQGQNRLPVWSPDSRDVVFQSDREGDLAVFRQRADGIGSPQRVTRPGAGETHAPESWAPDGTRLLLTVGKGQDLRLATFTFATATLAEWPGVTSQIPFAAAISHDGRWVAYQSGVSGANGIYVQSFPALDGPRLISSANSHHPQWSPDDRELFFIPARAQPVVVRISMQPDFSFTNPVPLAGSKWAEGGPGTPRSFDVVPGSGKIVGFFAPESQEAARLEFVLNWFEEVKRLSPVP